MTAPGDETDRGAPGPAQAASRPSVFDDPGVRREAARLRLITDRKLGKTSPGWVYDLAGEPRPA